jgi:putative acetyltransferase
VRFAGVKPPLVRRASFEDTPALLRLIERALEHRSRGNYRPEQRRAIYLSYASVMYVDVVGGRYETVLLDLQGRLVGMAQLDPTVGRLRALFVDGPLQGQGFGRLLLGHVEERAARWGCPRVQGAMSRDAVSFYARAGFRPCPGPDRLFHFGVTVPVVPMEKILVSP